jgi:acetoin utilization protein AcuB
MNTRQPSLVERRMRFMPCTVEPSDSVAHARALLDERRIKHLPVMSNERLVGIVSAHDLDTRSFYAKRPAFAKILEAHPDRIKINSVMTTDVRTVMPSDNLAYAAQLMRRNHIGALPVLEHDRLAGIISRSDVLNILAPGIKTKAGMIGATSNSGARGSKSARRSSPILRAAWSAVARRHAILRLRARHSENIEAPAGQLF